MAMMRELENTKHDYMVNKTYLNKAIAVGDWGKLNCKWNLDKKLES